MRLPASAALIFPPAVDATRAAASTTKATALPDAGSFARLAFTVLAGSPEGQTCSSRDVTATLR